MVSPIVLPLMAIAEKGMELGIKLLERSNDKQKKAYAVELAELRTKVFAERRKPLVDQIDSDIEAWEDRIRAIQDIALAEIQNYVKKN